MNRVICEHCGGKNPHGVIRCLGCDRVLGDPASAPPNHRFSFTVLNWIRFLLMACVLGLLVLICLPEPLEGRVDEDAALDTFYREAVSMEHAIRRGRGLQWRVREGTLNAYLERSLSRMPEAPSWSALTGVRVEIRSGYARLGLSHRWGPLELTRHLTVSPGAVGQTPLVLTGMQLGRLPLPPPLASWVGQKTLRAFSSFKRLSFVISGVDQVVLEEENALLVNQGNAL